MSEKTLEKLDLNKLEAKDGKLTVKHIHQELETPKVEYAQTVNLNGTIQAPGNFIAKRQPEHNHLKCNVQYSYRGLYIKLRTEEDWPTHYQIEGTLKPNPDLAKLKVNHDASQNWKMNINDMYNSLRFAKYFFAKPEQYEKVVSQLSKFSVSANKVITAENDNKGNVKDLYEIKSNSNIDLTFDLNMPVYIGQSAKTFRVEIAFNVRERSVDFWLESPELAEILLADAQDIINAELKRFPENYVFIEQ